MWRRYSIVGIATHCGLNIPGFVPRSGQGIFFSSKSVHTGPPMGTGALVGDKTADNPPHLALWLGQSRATPLPPSVPS